MLLPFGVSGFGTYGMKIGIGRFFSNLMDLLLQPYKGDCCLIGSRRGNRISTNTNKEKGT